jgi:hypothetical protein
VGQGSDGIFDFGIVLDTIPVMVEVLEVQESTFRIELERG